MFRQDDRGFVVESVVIGGEELVALRYRIVGDASWRVHEVEVSLLGDSRVVRLRSDGAGRWTEGGTPLPGFADAIDVDITATPFTNTLPIRRLGLRPGQSAEIVVAYVWVPELTVTAARQRYTCLVPGRYRFESLDSDFARDIDVDQDGLVIMYPGVFERLD